MCLYATRAFAIEPGCKIHVHVHVHVCIHVLTIVSLANQCKNPFKKVFSLPTQGTVFAHMYMYMYIFCFSILQVWSMC